MRGHRRKYNGEAFEHVFQRAKQYRVIFYSSEDRLVFYTIFSIMAWRYGVSVLALALMYNHYHTLFKSVLPKVRALFIGTVTSTYAKAFNRDSGHKGALFEKAYGNALKLGEKKVRTTVSYCYNNSSEKRLVVRAEQDRWNFLAYIDNDHPFSEPIILEKASARLRAALKEVDAHVADHAYLRYGCIRRLFGGLSAREKEQLTDYIISRYLPIDKELLLSFYKDYDSMVMAINSNTGSEYDIREEYRNDSDEPYTQMIKMLSASSFASNPHRILSASPEKKARIASVLRRTTSAQDYQIGRFLHDDS
ncbi:MAG: transposase [Bacteroidales bacterium]|nr:transposase [Bacteroidales bacterium]